MTWTFLRDVAKWIPWSVGGFNSIYQRNQGSSQLQNGTDPDRSDNSTTTSGNDTVNNMMMNNTSSMNDTGKGCSSVHFTVKAEQQSSQLQFRKATFDE